MTKFSGQELLPLREVSFDQDQNQEGVNARDFHAFLENKDKFAGWIADRIVKYGFVEGVDFIGKSENTEKNRPWSAVV